MATCCTTSPRADILAKYADRSAAPAAFQPCDHRPGKQDLVVVDLSLGQVVARDEREPRRQLAAGKQRRELANHLGPEPQRRQVVHVVAGVAGQRDGGQKLLQRLVLFAVQRLFAVFGFFQPQIVFQAALDGVVQRQLQRLARHRLRGHAAPEGIGRRRRVLRLRAYGRARRHRRKHGNETRARSEDKMIPSFHSHYFLR